MALFVFFAGKNLCDLAKIKCAISWDGNIDFLVREEKNKQEAMASPGVESLQRS
ncbi:MAG: hypothetical protein H0V01_07495 [Bacteroidetes bacterium]|nr:hypothetical protein [Bacteroidota bacterium]HET6244204.1 hypothetical protein [Bacteroidia bacterium]